MLMETPSWLPKTVPFSDFDTDWQKYLEHLFNIFKKDFIDSKVIYNNKPVLFDNRIINKKPACFWHLITEEYKDIQERNWSLLRCERICWIRPIIENSHDVTVSVWQNKRKRKINTIFFLEDLDYVVVLTNIKDRFYLLTAYPIRYEWRKTQLIKEKDKYLKMQKPPQKTETV